MTSWQASDCKIDCQMKFLLLKSNIFSELRYFQQSLTLPSPEALCWLVSSLILRSDKFKSPGWFHVTAIMTISLQITIDISSIIEQHFTIFNIDNRFNSIKILISIQAKDYIKSTKLDMKENKRNHAWSPINTLNILLNHSIFELGFSCWTRC